MVWLLCLAQGFGIPRIPAVRLMATGSPLDSDVDRGHTASWRSSRTDSPAVIFSAPSRLSDDMRVEVVERAEGWRTLK